MELHLPNTAIFGIGRLPANADVPEGAAALADVRHGDTGAGAMNQRFGAAGVRNGEEALKSLKQRPDLPARVRTLLEGMLERAANQFEHALSRTLDEVEQEIFKLAERARSNEQQHARFEALREIKRGRADVAPRFLLHVESTLAHVGTGAAKAAEPTRRPAMLGGATLELIDSEVLEEDLALQEVVSKSEIRHSQALYALSHRFGVLAGSPAFEPEVLPLGPAQLARALGTALAAARAPAIRLADDVLEIIGAVVEGELHHREAEDGARAPRDDVGRAVESAFDRHGNLLLHLLGGAAVVLRDDHHLGVGNIGVRLDLELEKGPKARADQRESGEQGYKALPQGRTQ